MRYQLGAFAPILLITLGLGIFSAGWSNPFVLDDNPKIRDNPDVRAHVFEWRSFFDAYSSTSLKSTQYRSDPSRPLTYISYWLLWQAGDGNPKPFHILSTVLHIGTSFLLGLLVLQLFARPGPALGATAIFLTLPLNAGTVFYAFGLSDIWCALFALAILNLTLKSPGGASLGCRILIGILFLLALAAKQSAVVIPVLVLAVSRRDWRLHVQLFVLCAAYLALRFYYFHGLGDMEAESLYAPGEYLWSQGLMILKYIGLILWPFGFSVDHAVMPSSNGDLVKGVAWLILVGLSVGSVLAWRRRKPLMGAALGWLLFIIPLLPTSSFFPTTDLFVERRAYLSSAGLIVLLVALGIELESRWPRWRRAIQAALVVVIGIFSILSFARGQVFSSEAGVYAEVLALYPKDIRALNNLATAHVSEKKFDLARREYQEVIRQDPGHHEALNNLGALYQLSGTGITDLEKAEEHYQRALAINANNFNSVMNMGFLLISKRRVDAAVEYFNRALRLNPRAVLAHYGLGKAAQLRGDVNQARRHFEEALRLNPAERLVLEEVTKMAR